MKFSLMYEAEGANAPVEFVYEKGNPETML